MVMGMNSIKYGIVGPVGRFQAAIRVVSELYGLTEREVRGRRRIRSVVDARQMAMRIVRETTSLSLHDIGTLFNRDHSTIIHAIKATENLLETSEQYRLDYEYAKNCYKQIVYPGFYDEERGDNETDFLDQ